MKLSQNFSLKELTASQTAQRHGISNQPTDEHIENLKLLCENVLQPVRDEWDRDWETRAVYAGGRDDPNAYLNTIEYFTIGSTGNGTDFGDLTVARWPAGGNTGSSTRAIFAGGDVPSTESNVIDYVTIASTGNATDFGDLTVAIRS